MADLTVAEPSATANGDVIAAGPTISFTAFGTSFVMTLTRNDALTRNLPAAVQARLGAAEFYTGTLAGNDASWVRLTRTGAALSGALWDGAELYAIEQFERVAAHVVAGAAVAPADPIIYRWADTLSALTDSLTTPAVPGGAAAPQKPATAPEIFDELAAAQSKLTPAQQLDIGLLADSEFVQRYGSNAETNMLSVANIVDGIFFGQLGVRINVAELRTYGVEPDAFTGTNASTLLNQLEQHKFDTPALRSKGLVHLFTGRDLDERPNTPAGGRLLGVANLGVLCHARDAAGLTQYTDLNTAAVVAAHEIGHNFGAPHDTEAGSACQAVSDGYLMAPFVNGSRTFSGCSVQQMEPQLAAATCFTNLPANDLSVQRLDGPAEVIATRTFNVAFAVDYSGPAEALEPLVTITSGNLTRQSLTAGLPAVCDYWQSSPLTCRFGRFQPGSGRVEFSAGFVAPHGGPAYVDVVVTSLNDYTPENNRYRFEFVVPDVRFVLESAVASRNAVKRSEVFEIDWLLVNEGQIPASGVVADFGVHEQTYEFLGVQTANGTTCSRDPVVFHHWLCPIGAVAPGATLALKLRLRAREFPDMAPGGFASGFIDLTLTAAEPIFNFANHWQGPRVSVASRISDLYAAMAPATAAEAGSKATLRLHGGNHGPDAVDGAELYVRTLGGFTFDAATSSSGTCATERGEMTCRLGTLPSGNTFDVVMDITVGAGSGDHEVLYQLDGGFFTYDSDPTNQAGGVDFTSVAAAPPPPRGHPGAGSCRSGAGGWRRGRGRRCR